MRDLEAKRLDWRTEGSEDRVRHRCGRIPVDRKCCERVQLYGPVRHETDAAIQSATLVAAELWKSERYGALEPGKFADMVAVAVIRSVMSLNSNVFDL